MRAGHARFRLVTVLVLVLLIAPLASIGRAQGGCGADPLSEDLGGGSAGATGMPLLDFTGSPVSGSPFDLRLRNALPGASAVMILSTTSSATPIPALGATLHPSPPFLIAAALTVGPDGAASGVVRLDPVSANLCGFAFVGQAGVVDPASVGGVAVTGGRRIRFGAGSGGPLLPRVKYLAGSAPADVAVADLDGDGRPDFVVADQGSQFTSPAFAGEVRVMLGEGGGSFAPGQVLSTAGISAVAVAVADVDGDTTEDLVVANAGSNDVAILLGNGDGTFGAATNFPAGTNPESVAAADLDGDGDLDLAFGNLSSDDVTVLLGNGDGTFGAATHFGVGSDSLGIGIADFDDDGADDLVVTDYFATVSVLMGRGDGTFGTPVRYPVGWRPFSVSIADLDGDGVEDLVVPNSQSDDVSVLLGRGDGSFGPPTTLAAGDAPFSVAIRDLDGDGHQDLAVANVAGSSSTTGSLGLRFGNGDGSFGAPVSLPGPGRFRSVAAADVDGDGAVDLVATDIAQRFGDNTVWVLVNAGDGSFGRAPQRSGDAPQSVVAGDFDADGTADLAVANRGSGDVTVHRGLGGGSFGAGTSHPAGSTPSAVAAGDLDGDGDLDLVVTDAASLGAAAGGTVLLGAGDGTFRSGTGFTAGSGPSDVALADFDRDAVPDLVVANGASNDVSVLRGIGDGSFAAATHHAVGLQPTSVSVADLDGDGVLDLATSNAASGTVSVLLGTGNGSFGNAASLSLRRGAEPRALAFADLDEDSVPDLLLADHVQDAVEVRLGVGDGTFGPAARQSCRGEPRALTVADFDGDGHLDVTAANEAGDDVAVLRGAGDGTLGVATLHAAGREPSAIAAGDLDGDGVADLAVACELSDDVWTLPNRLLR